MTTLSAPKVWLHPTVIGTVRPQRRRRARAGHRLADAIEWLTTGLDTLSRRLWRVR